MVTRDVLLTRSQDTRVVLRGQEPLRRTPMKSNLKQSTATGFPEEVWAGFAGQPMVAWWANQMAQTYRLATFVSLVPGLATVQRMRLFFADVVPDDAPKVPPGKVHSRPSRIPGTSQADLDEIKAAWHELEESKGDWSKAR
jgi:hypothetical protein